MASPYFFKNGDRHFLVDKLREFLYSRWYLTTIPTNKVCSAVFGASMTTMITEYQRYHRIQSQGAGSLNALFSVNSLLNEATYEQIGSEMSPAEIDATSVHDVEVKKLLYGISAMDICETWDAVAPVIEKDKFVGWGHQGVTENCFDYCKKQLDVVGRSMKSPWWGTSKKMKEHIYQVYLTEDVAGMTKGIRVKEFAKGVAYVKMALKAKTPVVVGVEDGAGSPNADKVTDHFVVIVGMGSDASGKYFRFYDNATSNKDSGTSDQNRLHVNCSRFEIKGKGPNDYIQGTQLKAYIVTQIRETQ